jgi:hypothetical protein
MKRKIKLMMIAIFMSSFVYAENEPNNFFIGKWDIMAYGTISGDQQMIIELKRVDGKLKGAIVGPTDDIKSFYKIEEKSDTVKLHFKHLLFKVNLQLYKVDEDHVTGKLQNRYTAKGARLNIKTKYP